MTTKQKIIRSAITIFNNEGCISTSMRDIASACDMSLSNLQHHFKTKEILLEEIMKEMCLVFDDAPDLARDTLSLKILKDMNSRWLGFQKEYKFYFTEINAILQNYASIQRLFYEIKSKRLKEYNALFNAFVHAGLFKPEPFPGFFNGQSELLWFIANYYLSTLLGEGKRFNQQTFDDSNRVALNIIFPMLSEKGILALMLLNKQE